MATKQNHLKIIKNISKGSRDFERLVKKRLLISNPDYIGLSAALLDYAVRFALTNPDKQVAFISNANRDKTPTFMEFFAYNNEEMERKIKGLKNLRLFNCPLNLMNDESTKSMVTNMKKGLNKNRRISANGGCLVLDNIQEMIFPYRLDKMTGNKEIMSNLISLTKWHKHNNYELVIGSASTKIPKSVRQIVGSYLQH